MPGGYYVEVAYGSQVPPGEAWEVEEKGVSGIHINIMEITHMARIPDLAVLVPQIEHIRQLQAMLQRWTCFQRGGNRYILRRVKRQHIHTGIERGPPLRGRSLSRHLPVAL